jgi:hypothetical protein
MVWLVLVEKAILLCISADVALRRDPSYSQTVCRQWPLCAGPRDPRTAPLGCWSWNLCHCSSPHIVGIKEESLHTLDGTGGGGGAAYLTAMAGQWGPLPRGVRSGRWGTHSLEKVLGGFWPWPGYAGTRMGGVRLGIFWGIVTCTRKGKEKGVGWYRAK